MQNVGIAIDDTKFMEDMEKSFAKVPDVLVDKVNA